MIHGLEEFTQVNVFVGKDVSMIRKICKKFVEHSHGCVTTMGFGDGAHHTYVKQHIRNALNEIKLGFDVFWHVNSMDVIKALPDIVRELNLQDDFRLTRIGTSAKTSTKGEPIAINYTLEELEASIEMELEMR